MKLKFIIEGRWDLDFEDKDDLEIPRKHQKRFERIGGDILGKKGPRGDPDAFEKAAKKAAALYVEPWLRKSDRKKRPETKSELFEKAEKELFTSKEWKNFNEEILKDPNILQKILKMGQEAPRNPTTGHKARDGWDYYNKLLVDLYYKTIGIEHSIKKDYNKSMDRYDIVKYKSFVREFGENSIVSLARSVANSAIEIFDDIFFQGHVMSGGTIWYKNQRIEDAYGEGFEILRQAYRSYKLKDIESDKLKRFAKLDLD